MKIRNLLFIAVAYCSAAQVCSSYDVDWLFAIHGADGVLGSAAQDDLGNIYIGSRNGVLRGFRQTGELLWAHKTGEQFFNAPSISTDGTVYLCTNRDGLCAIAPSGTVKWHLDVTPDIESSTAITLDGDVYFVADVLTAVAKNGQLKWKCKSVSGDYAPTIGSDGTVYSGSQDGFVYALLSNGEVKWRCALNGDEIKPFLAVDPVGNIRATLSSGHGILAISSKGEIAWRTPLRGKITSGIIMDDQGRSYCGTDNGELFCIDADGSIRWHLATGKKGSVGSAVIDEKRNIHFEVVDTLFSVDTNGRIFNDQTIAAGIGPLLLTSDGWIVAGTWRGLARIKIGSGPLSNCWPMERCDSRRSGCLPKNAPPSVKNN